MSWLRGKQYGIAACVAAGCLISAAGAWLTPPLAATTDGAPPTAVVPSEPLVLEPRARDFSLEQALADGTRLRWSASEAVRRKRVGRVFQYESFTELALRDLDVEIRLPVGAHPEPARTSFAVLHMAIEDLLGKSGEILPSDDDFPYSGNTAGRGQALSRVVVDGLRIVSWRGETRVFELDAGTARITPGAAALVFDAGLRITSGTQHLEAGTAGWLDDQSALYVRDDFRLDGQPLAGPAVLAFAEAGGMERIAGAPPHIVLADPFDRFEQRLLDRVTRGTHGLLALMLAGQAIQPQN